MQTVSQAALRISSHFSRDRILFFPAGASRAGVLRALSRAAAPQDEAEVLRAILEREEIGCTLVAPGVAMPHARIPGLERILPALAICPHGVAAGSGDAPIRVFVLFASPAEGLRVHLKFLAAAAALFQDEPLVEELVRLETPESVLKKLRQAESGSHAEYPAE